MQEKLDVTKNTDLTQTLMSNYLLPLFFCRFHHIYLNFFADTLSVNMYITHVSVSAGANYPSIPCPYNILCWLFKNIEALGKNAYSWFYSINVLIIHPVQHFPIGCFVPFVFHLIRFHLIAQIVIQSICAGVEFSALQDQFVFIYWV